MSESLRIATAQSLITPDVAANGAHLRDLMTRARQDGARLVHFPEGALSGYVKAQITSRAQVDWQVVHDQLGFVADKARALGLWVVVGCNHRPTASKDLNSGRPHNSLYIISDAGEVVARYDKRYCSNSEITDWYVPGRQARVFDVDGFRFGCALCIEIQFMEVFAEYERLDVDCVLFSTYSEDPMFWVQARAYAACNNYWLSFSAPAQCSATSPSGVIGPHGYELTRCEAKTEPDLQTTLLDKADPRLAVALYKARPWRRLARSGALHGPDVEDDPRAESPLSS